MSCSLAFSLTHGEEYNNAIKRPRLSFETNDERKSTNRSQSFSKCVHTRKLLFRIANGEKVRDYGFWVELHTLMTTSVNQDDKQINGDLKPYAQIAIL